MKQNRIYLDYNATAPLRPDVQEAMLRVMAEPLNASALHSFGREGRKEVEAARAQVVALIGAAPAQVIFNSGATEGNNTVLKYFAAHYPNEQILVSAIEHDSVLKCLPSAERIPVTGEGVLDLEALARTLKSGPKTSLVSVMAVNNETGVIQPITEAAALAHAHGAFFHSDAVQAAGRTPLNINTDGIDFITLSAHKMGGPQGVGALALGGCGLTPVWLEGGGQEKSARAGTENVAGIVGFGVAAAQQHQGTSYKLQEYLEAALKSLMPSIIIHGETAPRVWNTSLFSLPGLRAESLLMKFDLAGVALSNGSACSSGSVQPSHVLKAMGRSEEEARSAIRVSMGWKTTQDDLERFLEVFKSVCKANA